MRLHVDSTTQCVECTLLCNLHSAIGFNMRTHVEQDEQRFNELRVFSQCYLTSIPTFSLPDHQSSLKLNMRMEEVGYYCSIPLETHFCRNQTLLRCE